ncbi:MAG: ankyrin repeat domain-containing protein [Bacteroidota bacterium]
MKAKTLNKHFSKPIIAYFLLINLMVHVCMSSATTTDVVNKPVKEELINYVKDEKVFDVKITLPLLKIHGINISDIKDGVISESLLHIAAKGNNPEIIRLLLPHFNDPNLLDNAAQTPLLSAIRSNKGENVKELLKNRRVVAFNNQGNTQNIYPIHYAASLLFAPIVKVLAAKMKDISQATLNNKNTILHLAVLDNSDIIGDLPEKVEKNPKALQEFLKEVLDMKRINPALKNKNGETFLDMIKKGNTYNSEINKFQDLFNQAVEEYKKKSASELKRYRIKLFSAIVVSVGVMIWVLLDLIIPKDKSNGSLENQEKK